jgi:hypothetical protein
MCGCVQEVTEQELASRGLEVQVVGDWGMRTRSGGDCEGRGSGLGDGVRSGEAEVGGNGDVEGQVVVGQQAAHLLKASWVEIASCTLLYPSGLSTQPADPAALA